MLSRLSAKVLPLQRQSGLLHVGQIGQKESSPLHRMLPRCFGALLLVAGLSIAGICFCSPVEAQGHLKATATATAHSVTLTWTEAANPAGPVSFNVYRGVPGPGPYPVVGTTSALTYVDTAVTAGTTYVYQVTAFYSPCPANSTCTESAPSGQVTATIPNPITPNVPTGLSGTVAVNHLPNNQDLVVATWSDTPNVQTGYIVFSQTYNHILAVGPKDANATGSYSQSWTWPAQNGIVSICDAKNACLVLPFSA